MHRGNGGGFSWVPVIASRVVRSVFSENSAIRKSGCRDRKRVSGLAWPGFRSCEPLQIEGVSFELTKRG